MGESPVPEFMQVVSLVAHHRCPLSGPVASLAGARATHLFHRGRSVVVELHADQREAMARLSSRYVSAGGELLAEDSNRRVALFRFPTCPCCRAGRVISTIEREGHQYLPPARYGRDGERYQFLVLAGGLGRPLLDRLPANVTVSQVRAHPVRSLEFEGRLLVPIPALLSGVSDRQQQALAEAIRKGYFRIPRGVRSDQLARHLGVSRPSFDTLLRKAEGRIVERLLPYLKGPVSDARRVPVARRPEGSPRAV